MPRNISNPPNPWHATHVDYTHFTDDPDSIDGLVPTAPLSVYEEHSRSVLSQNNSSRASFRWSVNPYRGCSHGCAYCYARTSHQHLGFGAGTDFDLRIIAKVNAPALLRAAFIKPSWQGEPITFSGNTDCYQGLEAHYRLTRGCLEICRDFRNPVSVITKSPLITRDLDLLTDLARTARVCVFFSIAFCDDELARKIEPWAPSPSRRLAAMRALANAGITVAVIVAPVIPGLTEHSVPKILALAANAGATGASMQLLRLDDTVAAVWRERIANALPEHHARIENKLVSLGLAPPKIHKQNSSFITDDPQSKTLRALFHSTCTRLGLNRDGWLAPAPKSFIRPPAQSPQGELFAPVSHH